MLNFFDKLINKENEKDKIAIIISILFVAIGFIIIIFYKLFIGATSDNIIIILLLIPFLIYLAASGKLREFKGFGLEAKFSEAAREPIKVTAQTLEASQHDFEIVEKESVLFLEQKQKELTGTKPIILTTILGIGPNYYKRDAMLKYIEILSRFRNFKFVVFLDNNYHFVAYISVNSIREILRDDNLAWKFIEALNYDERQEIFKYPGIIRNTISYESSNADALREMEANNLKAMVVIDKYNNLKGIVTRDQIIDKIILALANKAIA